MYNILTNYDFPNQKVPSSKKTKDWAARCCDWVIAQGVSLKDQTELDELYSISNENIPDKYYKKILNPYNATKEKYTRFPATMRNYDMIKGVVRRYIGEYNKNPHLFIVGANNPEVIFNRDAKLAAEITKLIENAVAQQIQAAYAQWIQGGNDPQQFNPEETVDIEKFSKEFKENYIDDISAQGQEILDIIRDITSDVLFYTRAYMNFVSYGETYTYTDIVDNELIKRVIEPIDAFPIHTDNMFIEDDDMFACRRKLSYSQIINEFDEYLTENDRKFLNDYYSKNGNGYDSSMIPFNVYENYYYDVCKKFNNEDREFFKSNGLALLRDKNSNLYDVWHVVWKGYVRLCVVSFINKSGLLDQRIEPDNYKLNKEAGDISIEYIYRPQVYESVRIGGKDCGIYPYGARPVCFERNGKLPYNGVSELIPGLGKFSIIKTIIPYQVFYNIVAYHREMAIAKNKLSILMIAKSLLGTNSEDTIYKMIADGVLYIDDTEDSGMVRAQQVRMLNADISAYINQLTNLLQEIRNAALEQVDMTPQRFGEIATSAGKGTTEEAIARGSMGSVIVEYVMDMVRERDYARDMDLTKLAWIDGLNTSYRNQNNELKHFTLNINNHIFADYVIKAKLSVTEQEKLMQIKQFAFSAAQNGDMNMALAAIEGDNVASISKLIKEFSAKKDEHEMQLRQMDEQLEQMKQQFEIQKIQVKGEEDRKTEQLRGYIDKEIELIKADSNMISFNSTVGEKAQNAGIDRLNAERAQVETEKAKIAREKNLLDAFSKAEDRRIKEKDIESKERIARINKNRYDKK